MADPATYRPPPGTIPESPGVYRFRDETRRVLYVGKAKNLRNRINSYFADPDSLAERTRQMVTTASSIEWTVVGTELEALQLEFTWIREFQPRFNVMYRDDKSYPYLAITVGDEVPRVYVTREKRRRDVRYFGPYSSAWAIRDTLDSLLRVFPVRTCTASVYARAHKMGRPCLLGDIGKCSAPCVGRVTPAQHREILNNFTEFLSGKGEKFLREVEREMYAASENLEYERAAKLRNDVEALTRVMEKQAIVFSDSTDTDVMAYVEDELHTAVQVFHVRGGRVRGEHGWVVERVEELTAAEAVTQFCLQVYGEETESRVDVPKQVLLPVLPTEAEEVQALLTQRRGSHVQLRVPQRGDKRALQQIVERNASELLARHKLKRASDLTARSVALSDLAEVLELPAAPLRIEAYDISHGSGQDAVGSMVVFEDGAPRRNEYRRFSIAETDGNDDVGSLSEVLRRRFTRYLRESEEGEEETRSGFAYPPQLVVVDGGAPQVAAAFAVLEELELTQEIPVIGLAKRLEEIWVPDDELPIILPRSSEVLYLLQRLRDEAHRYAISYHRKKRRKRVRGSELENIPGLGEKRRNALLRHFGSVKKLREAAVEEISEVSGVGPELAAKIHGYLH